MVGTIGLRDAQVRCRPGLRALLHLLLAATLALYGLAPVTVLAPEGSGEPLVAWTLPDGSELPVCHGFPGDPAGGDATALHCLQCLVLGHAVAHAIPVAAAAEAKASAGKVDWPLPGPAAATVQARHSQGARAPPGLA